MKLKDKMRSPVGGFYYDDPILSRRIATDGSFQKLIKVIYGVYAANAVAAPANLVDLVEDSICMRQPPDRCYYTKQLGDQASGFIHTIAAALDRTFGTGLEKKARGCAGCGRRRVAMNSR